MSMNLSMLQRGSTQATGWHVSILGVLAGEMVDSQHTHDGKARLGAGAIHLREKRKRLEILGPEHVAVSIWVAMKPQGETHS
jgi:hypothetical protein